MHGDGPFFRPPRRAPSPSPVRVQACFRPIAIILGIVQLPPMDVSGPEHSHAAPRRARRKAAGLALLSVAAMAAAGPAPAAGDARSAEAIGGEGLPPKYDAVASHLQALRTGTITSSLAYVDENAAIFSAVPGQQPRQIAAGKRSFLPLYILSFGAEPASVTAYDCAERADSLYCTFTLKAGTQRPAFGLEFWVADGKISKVTKWYNDL